MNKLLLILIFIPQAGFAQNLIAKGDSCFKVKDYLCAGTNYDLYLKTDDSNGIAYRSALLNMPLQSALNAFGSESNTCQIKCEPN